MEEELNGQKPQYLYGCLGDNLQKLSPREAFDKILAGELLKEFDIEKLDLQNLPKAHSVFVENCRIDAIEMRGADIRGEISLKQCTIGEVLLSEQNEEHKTLETTFHERVTFDQVEFLQKVSCNHAVFKDDMVCHAHFREQVFSIIVDGKTMPIGSIVNLKKIGK